MSGYNHTQKSTLSITPVVHRRNHQSTSTSGGFLGQRSRDTPYSHTSTSHPPSSHTSASSSYSHTSASSSSGPKELGSHLRIAPAARYDIKDGFGETGPQNIREFPRLLAAEHLFVPPPEPEVIQMDDEEVQCQPLLFKKELESIQDYQNWLNDTVDPFLKDLKMVILQGKPDSLHDFVLQYVNSLETGGAKPTTVDREEYELHERAERKDAEKMEHSLLNEAKVSKSTKK